MTPPAPPWVYLTSTIMGLVIAPLVYAFFAVLHWVGQQVFRVRVPIERTVAATLLASGVLIVLMAPFQLLAFNMALQWLLFAVILFPILVIYFRAFGGATGVSPWVQFGISCFVWFVLACCCCGPMALLVGITTRAGH